MKRPIYLFFFPLFTLLFLHTQAQKKSLSAKADPKKFKNVIFILTDDHRYDFMGFTGRVPYLKTPNMDFLAKNGAYFKNAFVTTSLCSPSRASILTGQYSHVHTVVDNVAPMPSNLVFFPQYLQKADYQTSFFGKWHMGNESDKPQKGFNHWESFLGQGIYYNPTLNIDGKEVAYKDSAYITDLLTEHAIDWMKHRDSTKPFFMYLSHKAVHAPFEPAKRHKGLYANQKYPLPPTFYQTLGDDYKKLGWPEWVKQQRYSWHGVDYMYHSHDESIDDMVQTYCETLLGVDESIGSVLQYLRDNGFAWGEHGLIDKRQFYEESVKVPFLVYCPSLFKGGQTVTKMVQNIDVAPTIMDYAGLKKPDYMPGYSFLPILRGDSSKARDKIFYEYYWEYDFPMTPNIFGVRTDKFKYIRYQGIWDTNELYDLQHDPNETTNLIQDPKYADTVKHMANELFDWLESTNGMSIPLKRTIKNPFGDYRHPKQY